MAAPVLVTYLGNKFNLFSGDIRSSLVKKNIYLSFLIKGFSILISLLLVPLTLNYLSVYEFGVWLTLSSIFTWINYFDIGLGNGLRNRLTVAMAKGDSKLGQIYISTTFFILLLIVSIVFLMFLAVQPFLNWSEILNVRPTEVANLNKVIILSFAFFCINFVLKIIGIVYVAAQRPAINDLIALFGSLLSLIIIFILTKTTNGSLINIAIVLSAAPVVILLLAYPITFSGHFSNYKPTLRAVKPAYALDMMNLGVQFFILQISSLIIFGTSNIIISRILGPEQVAPYNDIQHHYNADVVSFYRCYCKRRCTLDKKKHERYAKSIPDQLHWSFAFGSLRQYGLPFMDWNRCYNTIQIKHLDGIIYDYSAMEHMFFNIPFWYREITGSTPQHPNRIRCVYSFSHMVNQNIGSIRNSNSTLPNKFVWCSFKSYSI
jgi:hypothetical protein